MSSKLAHHIYRSICHQNLTDWPNVSKKDRKSTRLNSSHSQISYAVFCLKKKKNKRCRSQCNKRGSQRGAFGPGGSCASRSRGPRACTAWRVHDSDTAPLHEEGGA